MRGSKLPPVTAAQSVTQPAKSPLQPKMKTIETEEQTCPQCGHEIIPSITEPCPRQGRYNGFADCPECGAILYTIDGEDFEDFEEEERR